ncbi:hypothetical protein PVA8_323 [Vibrio phage PVA8]|nr:hypothetical protein [Vibrio phage PC-Liy1]URQ03309.1 hypothetical protein PVA8_323 [Vibrio phage PVA8]WBM59042.1 hypothetical protein vBValMPVA8_320 [Vibrio phage vB_ValM_PVA8]
MTIFLIVSFFLGAYFMSELPPELRYKTTSPKKLWAAASRLQQIALVVGFIGVLFFYLLLGLAVGWTKVKESDWNRKA